MNFIDIIHLGGAILFGLGGIVLCLGGLAFLRFPDVYSRLHGVELALGTGMGLTNLGLIAMALGTQSLGVVILFTLLFGVVSPMLVHAVATGARARGHAPLMAADLKHLHIAPDLPDDS